MNNIPYTYKVAMVDKNAKSMLLIYSSPGKTEMRVGARLPFLNETLDEVAAMFAPTAHWAIKEAEVIIPEVGTVGSWTPPNQEDILQKQKEDFDKMQENENIKLTANIQRVLSEMIGSSV